MKHAFLILAHEDTPILRRLISELDDERNDIFIHFDSKLAVLPEVTTTRAGLCILTERVDVRWGDLSVVEGEYKLFEKALSTGPYAYYHLLSGADLTLKSQDCIHKFFDEHQGEEFIGYTLTEMTPELERKVMRWHLFPRSFRNCDIFRRALRALFLRVQELLVIKRNKQICFTKGSQWVSVTENMARLFVSQKDWALKTFTHTFCSDEIVMQTLCWNSPLKEHIHSISTDSEGCLRAISWVNAEMKSWTMEDLETLKQGPYMFGRKF